MWASDLKGKKIISYAFLATINYGFELNKAKLSTSTCAQAILRTEHKVKNLGCTQHTVYVHLEDFLEWTHQLSKVIE